MQLMIILPVYIMFFVVVEVKVAVVVEVVLFILELNKSLQLLSYLMLQQ